MFSGKEEAQKRNSDSITRKDLHIPNWLPCKRRPRSILVCKQALDSHPSQTMLISLPSVVPLIPLS